MMEPGFRLGLKFGAVVLGAVMALAINVLLFTPLIIPDPCAYHNGEAKATFIFKIFFDIFGTTGHHPEHSLVNLIVTTIFGGFAGWKVGRILLRSYDRSSGESVAC